MDIQINTLAKIKHPNVLNCEICYEDEDHLFLVYKKISCVKLSKYDFDLKTKSTQVKNLILQLFQGLLQIHKTGLILINMNPDNILIDKSTNTLFISNFSEAIYENKKSPLKKRSDIF